MLIEGLLLPGIAVVTSFYKIDFMFFLKSTWLCHILLGEMINKSTDVLLDQKDLAQRNPKLLFFTSGVKKLRLNVGALKPHP